MKRFFIHNRKQIVKAIVKLVIAAIAYELAHKAGTAMRGYEAIGGEIFVPLFVLLAEPILDFIKEPFKAAKN